LNATQKAAIVRDLLRREGATQPFWTTVAGGGNKPTINIVCQDLKLAHALDDFLRECVKEAKI